MPGRTIPMKIAICDDDNAELQHILNLLSTYQKEHNRKLIYKGFTSSFELASTASQEQYDMYLLDVIMPILSGMELAKEIRSFDKAADILFLTSSPEFAVESYTVKASNYLLKPIVRETLFPALDDVLEKKGLEQEKSIVVKSVIGVRRILLCNLVCVEAFNRKIIYYLRNGEQLECSDRFSTICDVLLKYPEFILPHRSFLVNMNFIRTISSLDIQLQNGKILPLAQRRLTEIRKCYLAFQMEELS